jgi:CheY-like chemotaxis protein
VKKILYIEDNDFNVYVLRLRMKRAGFEVAVAPDAEDGLAQVAREPPDLILMDLNLPGIDGWEATRRLKAAPESRHIPVVALSAHAMEGDREKAFAAGCDDYETKPVDFNRLIDKVRRILGTG